MSRIALCLFLLFACVFSSRMPASADAGTIHKVRRPLKDQYIVKLNDALPPAQVRSLAAELAGRHGGKLKYVWEAVVPGFSVEMPEPAALAMSRHPLVDFVEENAEWRVFQVQANAPWHLDRLDQRTLPLDGYYTQDCIITDVFAYVLDTGVRGSHQEFWTNSANPTSRVLPGPNFYSDGHTANNPCSGVTYSFPSPCDSGDRTCLGGGHGTAVASVLGGRTYGVAKSVKIIPVRTHNCFGESDTEHITEGLQWIYNDKPARNGPAVLNISSGFVVADAVAGGWADRLSYTEMWIDRLINERNITVVVSANNEEYEAWRTSPARMARGNGGKVITVGGSTNNDRRWHCNPANPWESCSEFNRGSNFGHAVDIFAPSQNISSAGIKELLPPDHPLGPRCCQDSDTAERQGSRSGTSFAAPIVAGVIARMLIGTGASLTPDQVWNQILTNASGDYPSTTPPVMQDVASGVDPNAGPLYGSPNRLVFQRGVTRCRAVRH